MKKLVTSGLTGCYFLLMGFLSIICSTSSLNAQGCILTCPPNFPPVPVSVPAACEDILTYAEIGVTQTGCIGEIEVDIIENGVSIGNVITIDMVGNTYMVIISNPTSG